MTSSNSAVKALAKADPASNTRTIKFPVLSRVGGRTDSYEFKQWKDVKVPKAKFYIYKDEYHKCLHIGTLSDLLGLLGSAYYDFEDFDASYIIKSFDTLKDAVKYARSSGKKFYDSDEFMNEVIEGNIVDSDLYWDGPGDSIIDILLGWGDIDNLPDDWADVEDTSYE